MNLSDATAEFARQLVIALAGDAGRAERTDADVRVLRKAIADERDARLHAELERDKLRGAVQTVLASESDLLSTERAELLRDALGEPVGPDRDPELVDALRQRVRAAKNQRDELLRAARASILSRADRTAEDAALRNIVDRVERERRSG